MIGGGNSELLKPGLAESTLDGIAPRTLELASTIAEFHRRNKSWADATKQAAKFKGEKSKSTVMIEARQLAT